MNRNNTMKRRAPLSFAVLLGFITVLNRSSHGQEAGNPFACVTNNGTITIAKYVATPRKTETRKGIEPLLANVLEKTVEVPATLHGLPVVEIGANAFARCPEITSIRIPEGIRRIGDNAFRWCPGLQALQIPASVTSVYATAFADCPRLTAVRVNAASPAYWNDDDGVVFSRDKRTLVRFPSGRTGDYKVPGTVAAIGDCAFVGCRELKSVELSVGVTAIGPWAFADCSALTKIKLPNTLAKIDEFAFWGCGGLNALAIPESVTNIGYFTFAYCSGLTSATIPRNVTAMGPNIFRNCGRLTNVVVDAENPSFCSVDGVVFDKQKTRLIAYPCGRAGSYVVPDGVTFIDQSSFRGAGQVTSVRLPRTVTGLGYKAFIGCSAVNGFFFEGDAPTQRRDVFSGCGRATVFRQAQAKHWGKDYGGRPTADWDAKSPFAVTNINGEVTILRYAGPDETAIVPARVDGLPVTAIGNAAFRNIRHLTRVTLPDTVVRIGWDAFRDCSSLTNLTISPNVSVVERNTFWGCTALQEISLPDGVRKIGANAFGSCSSLTKIRLPPGVSDIGGNAFSGSLRLTAIHAAANSATFASDRNGVLFSKDKTRLVCYPIGKVGDYTVPSSVTNIAASAFESCTGLTSVALSRRLGSIGNRAFARCPNLNRVMFSTSVTDIGAGAFQDCVGLPSVELPDSLVSLGDGAFWNCPRLIRVELPARVSRLAGNTFAYCDGLAAIEVDAANPAYASDGDGVVFSKDGTTLTCYPAGRGGHYAIPTNVTQINRNAFEGCRKVADVVMPDRVTRMGDYAFKGCTALTNVVLSAALADVSTEAFSGCPKLCRVTVPASVTRIGDRAFQYCPNLAEVHFGGNAPRPGRTVFRASPKAVIYHRPDIQGWGKEFAERSTVVDRAPNDTSSPIFSDESSQKQFLQILKKATAPQQASAQTDVTTPISQARSVAIGNPAPAPAQVKYVQGEPVAAFEKGKVYVVEFWATWCGPCRKVIPHVNALQAKFKDRGLVVIGQNVWERGASVEQDVAAFVKQMGADMTYRVALDRDGAMAETWLKAAGRNGIPCAFVVGRDGKIAWIGHPLSGLDEAVERSLSATATKTEDPFLHLRHNPR